MKTCYIFGAADGLPDRFKKNEEDLVIAADSGINHLEKFGALPDIAVGDFDSLGFVPDCGEVIRHPVMKDDTDTMLAVKTGFERGYDRFIIYGGVGGRPDTPLPITKHFAISPAAAEEDISALTVTLPLHYRR